MTKDEIQSGNELIAKFMGYKSCFSHITDKYNYTQTVDGFLITGKCNAGNHQEDEYENFAIEHLIFHLSWDWIMPVVDKISDEKHWSINATMDWLSEEYEFDGFYNIKDVFKVVVLFIKDKNK